MQAQLQTSFQRVEHALQRLTDSIAAYNPSVQAAEELQAADDAVNADLKKLVVHQRNHQRKEQLAREAAAHDREIRDQIRRVAATRRDLLDIPAYRGAEGRSAREVDVHELLRYAKFIGQTTVPPTLRKHQVPPPPPSGPVKKEEEEEEEEEKEGEVGGVEDGSRAPHLRANGTTTTPPPPPDLPTAHEPNGGAGGAKAESAGMQALPDKHKVWLREVGVFEPWPEHMTIARGALGAVQRMVEAGMDPAAGALGAGEGTGAGSVEVEKEVEEGEKERGRAEGGGGSAAGVRRRETVEDVFNPDEM